LAIVRKAALAAGDESMRQSVSLFIRNQTNALIPGNVAWRAGRMPPIHAD